MAKRASYFRRKQGFASPEAGSYLRRKQGSASLEAGSYIAILGGADCSLQEAQLAFETGELLAKAGVYSRLYRLQFVNETG